MKYWDFVEAVKELGYEVGETDYKSFYFTVSRVSGKFRYVLLFLTRASLETTDFFEGLSNQEKAKLMKVVKEFQTKEHILPLRLTDEQVAEEILNRVKDTFGYLKWGKGYERKELLEASGFDYNVIQKIVNDKVIAQSARPITKDELDLLLNEYILTGHRNWLIENNVVEYLDITEYTKIYYYQPGNHLDKVLIGSFPYRMFMNQKGMLEVAEQLISAVEDLRKHGIK